VHFNFPEPIGDDSCELAKRWILDPHLAALLLEMDWFAREEASRTGFRWPGLWIISGFRTQEVQAALDSPAENSLHTRCPSMAVDLRVGGDPASSTPPSLWNLLGVWWELHGGRWGGRFGTRPGQEVPRINEKEMNHFDLFSL